MSVKDSPEFQNALKEACDNQWQTWLYGGVAKKSSKRNVEKDLNRIQQIKQDAQMKVDAVEKKADSIRKKSEELRRLHDPSLKRITENYKLKNDIQGVILVCPKCGDSDHGNKMNGKPWCMSKNCNVELVPVKKIAKWVDIRRGNMNSVYRKLRGMPV